jgi:hypothetical protein
MFDICTLAHKMPLYKDRSSILKKTCKRPKFGDALPLFERLKCESNQKTVEEGGVRAHSLAHSTLRGRKACWNSEMGLGRVDKLHSLTRACTKPTQGG